MNHSAWEYVRYIGYMLTYLVLWHFSIVLWKLGATYSWAYWASLSVITLGGFVLLTVEHIRVLKCRLRSHYALIRKLDQAIKELGEAKVKNVLTPYINPPWNADALSKEESQSRILYYNEQVIREKEGYNLGVRKLNEIIEHLNDAKEELLSD